MPARTNPQEYADKWKRRTAAARADFETGVRRVSESPMAAAARQFNKMVANWNEAIQSGKWLRKIEAVSVEDWRTAMLEKGAQNFVNGVNAADAKVLRAAQSNLANINTVTAEVERMPNVTIDDSIARMTHYVRRMKELSGGTSRR